MNSIGNIPRNSKKRIVIIGAGFAGLKLAKKLMNLNVQIVIINKQNFHQFQPLFYQVATAGLEPSGIAFPVRKVFQSKKNVHFRTGTVENIDAANKVLYTDLGSLYYDQLVIATGVDTNYFGMKNIEKHAVPMKSISEAIQLRNTILNNYETAVSSTDEVESKRLMNIVVAGGGPTGVELSGALAEMKNNILPKDYPELDFTNMNIHLLEGSNQLLGGMSKKASSNALSYLNKLGVKVTLNAMVTDFDGQKVQLKDNSSISSKTLIWAAGVAGKRIAGLPDTHFTRGNRLVVDATNQITGLEDVYAIGDIAYMETKQYPNGHPQVAQVAIQQAQNLAKNIKNKIKNRALHEFKYSDKGSMATIGRNLAVADLPGIKMQGFFAWVLWLFVHLMSIVGVKNRVFIFINWMWSYITYDQSLRLMITPEKEKDSHKKELKKVDLDLAS